MLSIGAMAIQRLFRPPLPRAVDIDDEDILMKSILMKLVFAIAAACIVASAPLRAFEGSRGRPTAPEASAVRVREAGGFGFQVPAVQAQGR